MSPGIDSKTQKRIGFISLEAINHFLKPAFTSLMSLIVIRWTGDEIWGLFVPFLIGIELLLTVLNWGQKPYLIRAFSLRSDTIGYSWFVALWSRSILLIPLFLVSWVVPLSFSQIAYCLIWILLRFFVQSLEPIIQFNRSYGRSILAELASLVVACVLLFAAEDVNLSWLFSVVIVAYGIKSILLAPLIPIQRFRFPVADEVMTYIRSALPFLLLSLLGLIQAKVDLYLVTWYMPESDIAYYQVLSGFLVIMQTGAFIILGPFQKNIYRMNAFSLSRMKRNYFLLGLVLVSVGSLAVVAALKWLFLFEIHQVLIPLIVAYNIPLFWYLIESQILLKNNREKDLLMATFISALFGFAVCYLGIPHWGIYGALVGGIFARVVIAVMVVRSANKISLNAKG